jgi:hypothetical protein
MIRKETIALALAAALAACSKPTPGRSDNSVAGPATANATAPAAAANAAAPAGPAIAAAPAVPATPGGAGAAAATGPRFNPGEWETVSEMSMTGLPSQTPDMAKGRKQVSRHCLTPEKAREPHPELFGKPREGCTQENVAAGDGRIQGTLTCKDPHTGGTSRMTLAGTYSGDNFDVRMKAEMGRKGRTLTMETHSVGHRVGDCKAGQSDD